MRQPHRAQVCLGLACACLGTSCVDTATVVSEVELRVSGTETDTFESRNGWQVELEVARLAFGPVTFCPGNSAGEFCDTARGEWLDSVVVDALSEQSRRAGSVVGTSGPALSWMYDYGFVSLLTQNEPLITDAASELDDNSVVLQGCAQKNQERLCFSLRTRVAQTNETEQGVPVVRVGSLRGLDDLAALERISARFDPTKWVSTVDFDLVLSEQQALGRDCTVGCEDIGFDADSQAVRAVQTALAGSARPQLSWR